MYDAEGADDGLEWIEVYNDSDVPVDLTSYKLFEGEVNHKIISLDGIQTILAHSYAVISSNPEKFKNTTSNFSSVLFKSSFALNNTGEKLAIKDKDQKSVDEYTYNSSSGGAEGETSLQKIENAWKSSKPTPGLENKLIVVKKVAKAPVEVKKVEPVKIKAVEEVKESDTSVKNLEAQAIGSEIMTNDDKEINLSFYLSLIGAVIVIILGGTMVYFVRKNGVVSKEGDDFEILEE